MQDTTGSIGRFFPNPYHNLIGSTAEECQAPPEIENLVNAAMVVARSIYQPLSSSSHLELDASNSASPRVQKFTVFHGIESESNEFASQSPSFFFVNAELHRTNVDEGIHIVDNFAAAIFKKIDNFYLCGGQSNSKVFRIGNPSTLFFTEKGHDRLEAILSLPFSECSHVGCYVRVKLPKVSGASFRLLFVPKQFPRGLSTRSHLWDEDW
jgi:hypothetical protein